MIAYDVNFCFPVKELENDRLKLTPFIPSLHAQLFYDGIVEHPQVFNYMSTGPWSTFDDFLEDYIENTFRKDPSRVLFAIIDKTRTPSPGTLPSKADFAGALSYINTSSVNLTTEIGYIVILPPFQRTHVNTNACGLLMLYALDLPNDGGLGLRRVQWQASHRNTPSITAAKRLGFMMEGILRWDRVMPGDRAGLDSKPLREGDPRPGTLGRDTAILAICWEEWEEGYRENLLQQMERRR
ncbi:hypothetical protein ID866_5343 [Astraeus odoratus]|nr:hypothetical protein ID866_5343 [Astraeus odoratus]